MEDRVRMEDREEADQVAENQKAGEVPAMVVVVTAVVAAAERAAAMVFAVTAAVAERVMWNLRFHRRRRRETSCTRPRRPL